MKRMFSVAALLSALLGLSCLSQAQVDTSTTQKLLQYIMQPLDKTQIATGYLEEYGCPMLPMATFSGQLTDSNRIDMNLWHTLYFQLQTGWVQGGTNPLPAITAVNNAIKQQSSGPMGLALSGFQNLAGLLAPIPPLLASNCMPICA